MQGVLLCAVGTVLSGLVSGETCVNWREGNKECEHGCCGDYGDHYCCFHWKVYAIVGGVIGGLVIIGGLAFLVFFLCYYQQHMKQKKVQPGNGHVMQTFQSPQMVTQTAQPYPLNHMTQPVPAYPAGSQLYPAGPQPYPVNSQMAPQAPNKFPPPYGQPDPAYPPQ